MPGFETVGNNKRTRILYPISSNYSNKFDYKTKLVGKLPNGENELEDIKIVVPLKSLSNFVFNLDFLLINADLSHQVVLDSDPKINQQI